jgi:Inositol monophosphatase family
MFCLLAEGAVDVAVGQNDERAWELAAPVLLVTEAGGCVTNLAGRPWTEGRVAVASNRNRLLHAAVLAAIPGAGGAKPAGTRLGPRQLSPAPSPNPDTGDGSRAAVLP